MLKPLHDNVILKREEAEKETMTANGIVLTDNTKNVPSYVTVITVGPDNKADIEENDRVVYKEYSGTNIKLSEEEYIIIEAGGTLVVLA